MTTDTKTLTRWVVILTGIGSLMAALDTLVVASALSKIRLDLGASVEQLEWTVNSYNLSFAVLLITGAALGDRFGRRTAVCGRPWLVRDRVGGLRAGAERRRADRRASRAGRRFGADHAARAGAAELGVPAREARRGDRDVQRDHRPGGRQRPADRRRGRAGDRLAVDLLAERADRGDLDPAGPDQACARATAPTPASTCAASRS